MQDIQREVGSYFIMVIFRKRQTPFNVGPTLRTSVFAGSEGGSGVESIYERLYRNTVKNTTIHLPPTGEGNSAVKVKVDFKLIRIIDLVSMYYSPGNVINCCWYDFLFGRTSFAYAGYYAIG